jgi:hypothetical protein
MEENSSEYKTWSKPPKTIQIRVHERRPASLASFEVLPLLLSFAGLDVQLLSLEIKSAVLFPRLATTTLAQPVAPVRGDPLC